MSSLTELLCSDLVNMKIGREIVVFYAKDDNLENVRLNYEILKIKEKKQEGSTTEIYCSKSWSFEIQKSEYKGNSSETSRGTIYFYKKPTDLKKLVKARKPFLEEEDEDDKEFNKMMKDKSLGVTVNSKKIEPLYFQDLAAFKKWDNFILNEIKNNENTLNHITVKIEEIKIKKNYIVIDYLFKDDEDEVYQGFLKVNKNKTKNVIVMKAGTDVVERQLFKLKKKRGI